MRKSLPLFLLLPVLLSKQLSAQNIPYKSYLVTNSESGQPSIRYQLTDNYFYAGASRFLVTTETSGISQASAMFDASYEGNACVVPAGGTGKITIDLTAKGLPAISYPGGKVYLHFYYQSIPQTVTGRVQKNDDTWVDITGWTNIANPTTFAMWQGTIPGNWNNMKKLEFTITAQAGVQANLSELEYVPDRPSNEFGLVSKFTRNVLFNYLQWKDNSNTLAAEITENGNAYFKGNIGINTVSPTVNLQITGSSIVSGNMKLGSLTMATGAGAGKVLTSDATGNATWQTAAGGSGGWGLGGSTVGTLKTFGTLDAIDLPFITGGTEKMRISKDGSVGIGITTFNTAYKLFVEGNIRARKVRVDNASWPDYVFQPEYPLMPLNELEKFIQKNRHLPEIPSAKEVSDNGVDLGSNQAALLKKIEELTLYIIQQNKRIEELEKTVKQHKR